MEKKQELIEYWIRSSDYDFDAARDLCNTGKNPHALFFGHLALEKIIKALFIKYTDEHPPRTHNLVMLVKNINIDIPEEIINELVVINTFNIEARYPDEKYEFYQKCTAGFTSEKMKSIGEIIKWFKEKLLV